MDKDDVLNQAQWEYALEQFELAVEAEKARLRKRANPWWTWRIHITIEK